MVTKLRLTSGKCRLIMKSGGWLKVVLLIDSPPHIKRGVEVHPGDRVLDPLLAPCHEFVYGALSKCDKIIWRIVDNERSFVSLHQLRDVAGADRIQATDPMTRLEVCLYITSS